MAERPIERWARLRAAHAGDGVLEVPSLASKVDTGFGFVRFALGPAGEPRLLVPFGAGSKLGEDVSNGRLVQTISRYQLGGRWTSFIDVMCVARPLDAVFAELASEIVHRIGEGTAPVAAVDGAVRDFRSLLEVDAQQVPDQQILGLVGELSVLNMLTGFSASAVDSWTGPFGQRHDFRRTNHAIEVKSSFRADSTIIRVSSIGQLSEPLGGSLMLAHVRAERSDDGELSVGSLCEKIVSQGVAKDALGAGLLAMGCSDPNSAAWNRIRFSHEGVEFYAVTDGFPRITERDFAAGRLPAGTGGVSYALDLASAEGFRMDDRQLSAAVARMFL
jgi:hypothetical protein